MSLLAAILVFSLIILIHEGGHFFVAKRCGVKVVEFCIGMGPKLISFQKGETTYAIRCLPFGGACTMQGEDQEDNDPRAFLNQPVWHRIAVVSAGPIANFLLAFLLAIYVLSSAGYDSPQVVSTIEGMPAEKAGLLPGDLPIRFNNTKILFYRDITAYMEEYPANPVTITYKRLNAETGKWEKKQTVLTPAYSEEYKTYMLGIRTNGQRRQAENPLKLLEYSAHEVGFWIKMTMTGLKTLIRGKADTSDIAGPVRMVSIIDETVQETKQYGWDIVLLNLANMCMLLSANLGVMNLLPIPALDGGRLFFMLIEAVRGKSIDREKEGLVHMIGLLFLMFLMVIILFHDVFTVFFQR